MYTPWAYSCNLLTVVETLLFQRQWPLYWSEDERGEFAATSLSFPTPVTWCLNLVVSERSAGGNR